MTPTTHDGRRHAILAIDTATTRVVIATGSPDGTADGVSTWVAGYRHGETLLPSIGRFLGEQNLRRSRLRGHRRRQRAGGVHRAARGHGHGQGPGPRPGHPARRRRQRGGAPRRVAASSGRSCSCPPARPTGCSSARGSRPRLLPGGTEPDLAADETLLAVDLEGRAPDDAVARGETARDGLGQALLRLGAARLAAEPAGELATLVPEYVTLPRGASPDRRIRGMVARPPLRLVIEPMQLDDVPAIQAIEQASFTTPWPPDAYRSELQTNRMAHYLVARAGGALAAYGGMWLMVDEAHITTFAVHPAWRRQGIGERLLLAFLDIAIDRDAHEATLEVRLSNLAARRLYEKYGFRPVGLRPNYYSDDREDALIMTTEPLAERTMVERIARLRAALDAKPAPLDPADRRAQPDEDGA